MDQLCRLENIRYRSPPDRRNAAVIGSAPEKWDERPILIGPCKAEGQDHERADDSVYLEDKIFAKWQIPDCVRLHGLRLPAERNWKSASKR